MTIKCSVFIATSLDGFIARTNGDIQWLVNIPPPDPNEDYGFQDFFNSIDALVTGRKTYEAVLGFEEWPYIGKKVIVLSHGLPHIPEKLVGQVEILSGSPKEVLNQLEKTGTKHLYIDGGKTIQGFLEAGLIDEMTITIIPILLGEGIPLFGPLSSDILLELQDSQRFSNGFVQNRYKVLRDF